MVSFATTSFFLFGVLSTIWNRNYMPSAPPAFLFLFLGFICSGMASYTYSLDGKEQNFFSVEVPGGGRMPLPPPPPGYMPSDAPKSNLNKILKPYLDRANKLEKDLWQAKEKLADFEAAKKLEPPAAAAAPAASTPSTAATSATSVTQPLEFEI